MPSLLLTILNYPHGIDNAFNVETNTNLTQIYQLNSQTSQTWHGQFEYNY